MRGGAQLGVSHLRPHGSAVAAQALMHEHFCERRRRGQAYAVLPARHREMCHHFLSPSLTVQQQEIIPDCSFQTAALFKCCDIPYRANTSPEL